MTLLKDKLQRNGYPVFLSENLKHILEKGILPDSKLTNEEEVENFWTENINIIQQLY